MERLGYAVVASHQPKGAIAVDQGFGLALTHQGMDADSIGVRSVIVPLLAPCQRGASASVAFSHGSGAPSARSGKMHTCVAPA